MEQIFTSLSNFAVFRGAGSAELATIASLLRPFNCADGGFLFHQGEPAEKMLLIDWGSVEVLDEVSENTLVRLAIRQEGESVGEMALIERHHRTASIRALESTGGWSLHHDDFQGLKQQHPELFIRVLSNIARELSRRLQRMDVEFSSGLFASGRMQSQVC
ncbi:cyclic nucleotide-binding domain-containing protein [Motiliproteus sp. SC1-56]|uniref:cyclic nucleotide-binding domain-containing protein n=1 Tax=Motiliproteus sp. SC1-56 TaxID=2799565 RepID=UPI001A8F2032|nr:cyclic nucleotide-binding domain-containing protein [Motiliproteus sp. SC1-56]